MRFILGATWLLGATWTGSCRAKHLYDTTINQSGCLLLPEANLNNFLKRFFPQCKETYDMPKVSGNYNSDLPKVGSMTETDNLKLPKISHLFKVSKNDYYFA